MSCIANHAKIIFYDDMDIVQNYGELVCVYI